MGDAEGSEAWVAGTQSLLGAIIKRPKLTDALLKKPPFRFLHDIVSEVTKVTGFADGLYDEAEANSGNIKEKDAKIAYLQKIIDCVSFALGTKVDIRPNKVVAGMEPEATNTFLQLLARAATDPNIDRNSAVSRVLGGETTAPKPARSKEPAPPPPAPPPPEPTHLPLPMPEPVAAPLPAVAPEPPSGSALNSFQSEMPSADDGGGGKAARPRSARRPAPKVSSNVVKVEPTVPRGEATAVMRALIAEGAAPPDDDDDGGVEFVSEKGEAMASVGLLKGEGGEGHTKIVKDILETQKAMEEARDADGRQHADAADTRGGGGGGGGIILGRKKAQPGGRETVDRQRSKDEIQKLRADIQALCQSTNPLGKSLEYVHEDLDAMTRELEHWRGLHSKHKARLREEGQEVDGDVKALEGSLEAVEQQLAEEKDKIRALKSTIIRNDATISKLLNGVVQ